MKIRKKMVVGNWKMNGSREFATSLVGKLVLELQGVDVDAALCPPFPLLDYVVGLASGSSLLVGAQDVSEGENGAFTGDVSAEMLRDAGCQLVIIGHSERRVRHGETDELIAEKTRLSLAQGLTPVICIGETLSQRDAGQTLPVVLGQLDAVMEELDVSEIHELVIAYEPVWAIGTGRSATARQAQEVHAAIRERLACKSGDLVSKTRVLYGGSVKPESARELFFEQDIDGALVGGASLFASSFIDIARAAARRL